MTPHDLIVAFDTLAEAPDGVDRLRELVLQLAVRGKLVPQDPSDEPASALLERIANQKLVQPARKLEPVASDDEQWDLPHQWTWVRLRQVVDFDIGKTPKTKVSRFWADGDGYAWVSIADMKHYGVVRQTKRRVSQDAREETFRGPPKPAGTILMSFKLTIGKLARLGVPAYHNEAIISVFPGIAEMDNYLYRFLPLFASGGKTNAAIKGATLNKGSLTNLMVALPPLAEQHRIVARVDELMVLLDRLEAARTARDTTRAAARDAALAALREADTPEEVEVAWNRFAERMDDLLCDPADIDPLRQAVLQLAVRGKLVPQDAGDEPASVLLERIAAEKARLVKEKVIRKPKKLAATSENEEPFVIPDSWRWVYLRDLALQFPYGSARKSTLSGRVPVLRMGNMQRGEIDWTNLKYSSDDEEISKYDLPPMTVLFNRTNSPALVGKTAIYRGERRALFAGYLIRIHLTADMDPEYLNYVLGSDYARAWCWSVKADGISQSNISASKLAGFAVPVPPLAEQRRIVAFVKTLVARIYDLEERFCASRVLHSTFASAAVHHLDA